MSSKLSSLLVQEGRVPARRMADAFQRQVIFGGTLDSILLEMGLCEPALLADCLARAVAMPFLAELPDFARGSAAADAVARGFSQRLAELSGAVPLARRGTAIHVLVKDAAEARRFDDLEAALSAKVVPFVTFEYRHHEAFERLYGVPVPSRFKILAARVAALARVAPTATASDQAVAAEPVAKGPHDPSRSPARGPAAEARAVGDAIARPPAAAARFAAALGGSLGPVEPAAPSPPPASFGVAPPRASASPSPPAAAARLAAAFSVRARVPAASAAREPSGPRRTLPYVSPLHAPLFEEPAASSIARAPLTTEAAPAASAPSAKASLPPVATPSPATLDDFPPPAPAAPVVAATVASPPSPPSPDQPPPTVTTLSLDEARTMLRSAGTRDAVFEIVCRLARERFAFATVFVVQGDAATARMALGPAFFDASALDGAAVDLAAPSPLRAAVRSHAPFIGRIGADDALARTLGFLGRPVPAPVALLPIVLRDRAVAVLVADCDGGEIDARDVAEVVQIAADAASAFLRIIQSQKRGAPAPVPAAAEAEAAQPGPAVAALGADEIASLIAVVESAGADAEAAATRLLEGGEDAAWAVASYFPGPLRFGHRKLHTVGLPLVEHGPLVGLAARFGARIAPALLPLVEDPAPDVRFHAALALGAIRGESAIEPLGRLLFDADAACRRAAAFALSLAPPSLSLAALLERLRDEAVIGDTARERAATYALGELRDVAAVPALVDLLKHRDMEVVDLAHRALVVITKQDLGATRWRWRTWWEKARLASRIEWLLAGLEQPSIEVQRSAAEELAVIASDHFGFHARFPRGEREDAARRFAVWWKQHPHILGDGRAA